MAVPYGEQQTNRFRVANCVCGENEMRLFGDDYANEWRESDHQ